MKENDISQYGIDHNIDTSCYRPSVGILLFNCNKKVFMGERIGTNNRTLQMPQGGIDEGETAEEAAKRELHEEIGTNKVEIIYKSSELYHYKFPNPIQYDKICYIGQIQQWILAYFLGTNDDINIHCANPEFSKWYWIKIGRVINSTIGFRKKIYSAVVAEFEPILKYYDKQ